MALTVLEFGLEPRPCWPEHPFDPSRACLHYGPMADELRLWFDPSPVAWYSSPIDAPEGDDVAVMVGLAADDVPTGEIVGIHVYPLLAGAAKSRPEWRRLAAPAPPADLVARFVAEVRDLFERHWAPAPPIAEQLAAIRRGRGEEPAAG